MFKFQNFERIILLILAFVILMKTSTAIKLPYNSEYKPRAYAESQAFFDGLIYGGLYSEFYGVNRHDAIEKRVSS